MTNGSVISFCLSQWRASSWIPVKLIPTSSCRTTIPLWLRRDMKTGLCWAKSDSHGWVDHLAQCFSSSEKIWVCQHSNDGLKSWFGVCRYDLTWRSLCHLLAVPRTMRCSLNQIVQSFWKTAKFDYVNAPLVNSPISRCCRSAFRTAFVHILIFSLET